METLRLFRIMTVRLSIILTIVLAALGHWVFKDVVSRGLLAGGLGGTLAFWVVAYQTERLANTRRGALKSRSYRWSALKYAIYALVLGWAYSLDRQSCHGFLAAAVALFIVPFVVFVLGLTGLDLKLGEKNADGTRR